MFSLKDRIIKWRHTSSGTRYIGGRQAYVYRYKDKFHREDGPAIIYDDGTYEYYVNGILHRDDGPAVFDNYIFPKEKWYFNGKLHRLNGPAIHNYLCGKPSSFNCDKKWYIEGHQIFCTSQKEFEKYIKLLAFI